MCKIGHIFKTTDQAFTKINRPRVINQSNILYKNKFKWVHYCGNYCERNKIPQIDTNVRKPFFFIYVLSKEQSKFILSRTRFFDPITKSISLRNMEVITIYSVKNKNVSWYWCHGDLPQRPWLVSHISELTKIYINEICKINDNYTVPTLS
jgi:hypothetical protein